VVPSLPAAAPLQTLEESALEEVDDLSVLALDDVSDDDDKLEGEGLSSGEERGLELVKHRGSSGILLTTLLVSILISELLRRSSHLMSRAAFP
jgi:hypothetical protein